MENIDLWRTELEMLGRLAHANYTRGNVHWDDVTPVEKELWKRVAGTIRSHSSLFHSLEETYQCPAFFKRSPKWDKVRNDFLKRNPCCAITGMEHGNHVHHIIPVHVDPTMELYEDNLITLRPSIHLIFGHLGSWFSWNPTIREDVKVWKEKFKDRPSKEDF